MMRTGGLGVLAVAISMIGLVLAAQEGSYAATVVQAQKQHSAKWRVRQAKPSKPLYKPEKAVRIDLSKIDPQKTAAIAVKAERNMPAPVSVIMLANAVFAYSTAISSQDLWPFLSNANVVAEQEIAETLVHFYSENPRLLWSDGGVINSRAIAVLALFAKAGEDGLNPNEYLPDLPQGALQGDARMQALARFDLMMSARMLRYIRDAGSGRIIADRISDNHDLLRKQIDLDKAFSEIVSSDMPADILASYQPQSKWYIALKLELAGLDTAKEEDRLAVLPGTLIRPGGTHAQLPKIIALIKSRASLAYLEKFGHILKQYEAATTYNVKLRPAVQAYQKAAGKAADGIIGPITIAALQGNSNAEKRRRILYAMERLRWLPRDFSQRYVFINTPAFKAQYVEEGIEKLSMKAVVGSVHNQTTFFYDTISQVVFNPYWGVPQSIIRKEMIPRILAEPGYLARRGYEVYNSRGRRIAPEYVNWRQVAAKGYGVNVRQRPGAGNALGELKILFPNRHDIYMHDTPAKSAFKRDMRAISHGCVRLADPRGMAAAVMGMEKEALGPYFGKNERAIKVREPLPVYLGYFTAWPDAATGNIIYYDDIYGHDRAMQQADALTRASRLPAVEARHQAAALVRERNS